MRTSSSHLPLTPCTAAGAALHVVWDLFSTTVGKKGIGCHRVLYHRLAVSYSLWYEGVYSWRYYASTEQGGGAVAVIAVVGRRRVDLSRVTDRRRRP